MTPAATSAVRMARQVLCVGITMALGLTCAVLAVALSSGGMGGMGGTMDMSVGPEPSATITTTTGTTSAAPTITPSAATDVALATSAVMTSMCKDECVGLTTGVLCMASAGFVLTAVMVLLLASPRLPFFGLLARIRRPGLARRRLRERTPWLVPSPVSLCVFRV